MNPINISEQIKRVLWGGLRRDLERNKENVRHLDLATTAVWDPIYAIERNVLGTVAMAIEDEMIITR